ncbi:MAG: PQQ-binding-like beta-propeller repeat protein [Acidobacteria bacterium]|nr:PQQ-binding-like beta-propeller repeat protein [Acidobacteriota bacterium]MBI3426583.1 PQQ-binding-like beta-propeller repeat protein [Acidobacteriota bacterium]
MRHILTTLLCLGWLGLKVTAQTSADWAQWGGPERNFKSAATGLAANWPATGPRKLWSRALGDGYSSIAVAGGRLFTMYRKGEQEVAIALDAATGKTLWEYGYDAPFWKEQDMSNGPGPHSTPLVVGEYVFTTGTTGKLHALNKQTGKLVWSHELFKEYNGTVRPNGYSCSPLAYKNMVIVMVGGTGHALMAFNQKDGAVVWQKHDFKNSTSSPILINVDGQEQLVAYLYGDIVGVDPRDGVLLWSQPHETDFGLNTMTPVWGEDNLLFVSSGYSGGSRVLKLTRAKEAGGKTKVEELWFHRLMRVHFGTCIRVGDLVYGSSGDFGPAPFTAINVKTGQIVWRDRSLPRATFLLADGRFILLDEDGNLALATPAPEGLKIQAKTALMTGNSWTVPALAGTTLYVRDRKTLMALDLKAGSE